jgi:hypothetical protein
MFDNACIHAEDILLDTKFDLTDKKGILAAKMKIVLSGISRSGDNDNIEEFMKKVDNDVNRMSSLPSTTLSTFGQVLKSTKAIMDQFSKVVHHSSLNLIIVNRLIELIRCTRYSMRRGSLFPVFTR